MIAWETLQQQRGETGSSLRDTQLNASFPSDEMLRGESMVDLVGIPSSFGVISLIGTVFVIMLVPKTKDRNVQRRCRLSCIEFDIESRGYRIRGRNVTKPSRIIMRLKFLTVEVRIRIFDCRSTY